MMINEPIRDESEYEIAIAELHRLWGAEVGTAGGNRLDVLLAWINTYEDENDAWDAIRPVGTEVI